MAKMVFQEECWRASLIFLLEWKAILVTKKLCRNASVRAKAFLKQTSLVLLKCLNKPFCDIAEIVTINLEEIVLQYFWGPDFNVAPESGLNFSN